MRVRTFHQKSTNTTIILSIQKHNSKLRSLGVRTRINRRKRDHSIANNSRISLRRSTAFDGCSTITQTHVLLLPLDTQWNKGLAHTHTHTHTHIREYPTTQYNTPHDGHYLLRVCIHTKGLYKYTHTHTRGYPTTMYQYIGH